METLTAFLNQSAPGAKAGGDRLTFATAEFVAIEGSRPVEVGGDILTVKDITDGGIVILK